MLRKTTLILNFFALAITISPMLLYAFMAIKHPDAVSMGIVGGDGGPTDIFLSFLFDPSSTTPLMFLTILLCLNIYVIIKKQKNNNK